MEHFAPDRDDLDRLFDHVETLALRIIWRVF
jgi:hypothetical protein